MRDSQDFCEMLANLMLPVSPEIMENNQNMTEAKVICHAAPTKGLEDPLYDE